MQRITTIVAMSFVAVNLAMCALAATPVSAEAKTLTTKEQVAAIEQHGLAVEVDCPSKLATALLKDGWSLTPTTDGHCDAAPKGSTADLAFENGYYAAIEDMAEGRGVDVANAPRERVDALLKAGYWDDSTDGREMLYPPVPA